LVIRSTKAVPKVVIVGNDDPVIEPRYLRESLVSVSLAQFVAHLDVKQLVPGVFKPVVHSVFDVLVK